MNDALPFVLFLIFAAASVAGGDANNGTTSVYPLRIAVIGDWGTNNAQQSAVAASMARWAGNGSRPLAFVASTGDNFYPSGVASADDPQWSSTWQNVYLQYPSLKVPWHTVLGNHDYCGSLTAPLQYTKHGWDMRGHQYMVDYPLDSNMTARFLFVDTNPCVPEYTNDPECTAQKGNVASQSCNGNQAWLKEQLAAAASDPSVAWVVVFAHHNVGTPSFAWVEKLAGQRPFRVAAVFSGHTHCLAHQQSGDVDFFISGGGSRVDCDIAVPSNTCANSYCLLKGTQGIAGFMGVEISRDRMTTHVISDNGTVLKVVETLVPPTEGWPEPPTTWSSWFTPERIAFIACSVALFVGVVIAFSVTVFRRRRHRNSESLLEEQRQALLEMAHERRGSRE